VSHRSLEIALENWLSRGYRQIGEISIEPGEDGIFILTHRDETSKTDLISYINPDDATHLARFDDAGNNRPLKTAPNLKHGWRLIVTDKANLTHAIDLFYPGRLAVLLAWEGRRITITPLRETLNRQTGLYRSAAKITDEQADILIGNFCRSDGGCLRTILWPRDTNGTVASSLLPPAKFDPDYDQTALSGRVIPLLCQEACNLLVAEARKVVKNLDASPNGS
jgi:sirohydrochlorin cobaltochelatase